MPAQKLSAGIHFFNENLTIANASQNACFHFQTGVRGIQSLETSNRVLSQVGKGGRDAEVKQAKLVC